MDAAIECICARLQQDFLPNSLVNEMGTIRAH